MKHKLKKIGIVVSVFTIGLLSKTQAIAAKTPTFDNSGAQSAFTAFMDPLTTFLLFAIPGATAAILIFYGLKWLLFFDDEEKEKKPFARFAKRVVIVAVVCLSVDILLKIVGIG